jgi:hypothetical protein
MLQQVIRLGHVLLARARDAEQRALVLLSQPLLDGGLDAGRAGEEEVRVVRERRPEERAPSASMK